MRVNHRRHERRTAVSMVAVVAGVLLAAGCGGEQPGPATAGSGASTAPTGSSAPPASVDRPRDGDLVARLRRGGHVIYIRHAAAAGLNTVLVSHGFNLQGATGLTIQEGESAVFEHGGGSRPRLVARITVKQWQALAQG
jgi:hypothetical protein